MHRILSRAALVATAAVAATGLAAPPASAAPPAAAAQLGVANFGTQQGWRVDQHLRLVTDVTGDGRVDIVGFGKAAVFTSLGRADGTFTPARQVLNTFGYDQGWRIGVHQRWIADVTGDGKPDVVAIGDAGVWTAPGRGDGTFGSPRLVLRAFGSNSRTVRTDLFLADTNADGRPDVVDVEDGRPILVARARTDGTFDPPAQAGSALGASSVDFDTIRVVDVTGDGRAEILSVRTGGGGLQVAVPFLDGTYGQPRPAGGRFPDGEAPRLATIADVSGDHLPDLVEFGTAQPARGTYVARSLGDGTFASFVRATADFDIDTGWDPATTIRTVADITGTVTGSIVGFGAAGVSTGVNRSDGGSFFPARSATDEFGSGSGWTVADHPRVLGDVDGDARADIVGFGDAGTYTALADGGGGFAHPQNPVVTVPDVTGLDRATAESQLRAAGFTTRTIVRDRTDCVETGTVLSQDPAGGVAVPRGSLVTLTVANHVGPAC